MARKKREINTSLLDSVTADMLGGDEVDFLHDDSLRVERILLELVRPDPLQPRRVLPDRIYQTFHSGQMTPTQALRDLIQVAQLAARQHGRPFANVLDLMGNPDDENSDDLPPLSAEEQLVRDLVNLAITIRDDGQVNPLTVVDVSEGVTRQFRIETGERRYWATWLLRDFIPGYESDGMIPCIVIPYESASAFRQAKENTARSGLSAIAMARQAALLMLYVHGYQMTDGPVPVDFYRQALDLDLKGKREYTATIYAAMGGLDKKRFSRYKALLKLSDEAFELADRHNIDEYILRQMLDMPIEEHAEIVRHIVNFDLTAKQVREMCQHSDEEAEPQLELPRHTRQLVKLMKSIGSSNPEDIARGLLDQEADIDVARARLNSLRRLIDEAQAYLKD
ncbi:MAG: ParB N-terminal domain-containing protein [Anaerolineae bacterium]|nr:ParB N-terminal domain-containing protein [Anaerolineae bacterium]